MKMKSIFMIFFINFILLGNENIRLATNVWEPYCGPDLENYGFFSEIATAAFKEVDINLEIDFVPWKRAYELASNGTYDGLLGAYLNEERKKYFYFTDKIYPIKLLIFSKKSRKLNYKELKNLKDYSIGIVRGYSYSDEFDIDKTLKKIESPNVEKNMNLLFYDRVDVIIESELVFYNFLDKKFSEQKNDVIVLDEFNNRWLYILISKENKKNKIYIEKFNIGLEKIKKNGIYDSILKKSRINF